MSPRAGRTPTGPDPLGPGPAAPGREAQHPLAGRRRVADVVATVVLLVIAAVVAGTVGLGIVFLAFRFDSCGSAGTRCAEAFGSAVVDIGPVLAAVLLVASVIVSVHRLVRRRLAWPVAVIGIVLEVAVFGLAFVLVGLAVRHG